MKIFGTIYMENYFKQENHTLIKMTKNTTKKKNKKQN